MKTKILPLLLLLMIVTSCKQPGTDAETAAIDPTVTTYYFVRHADKDLSDPTNNNPMLTTEGHNRAMRWGDYFTDKNIELIYTTPYHRTTQTAAHIAMKVDSSAVIYDYFPNILYDNAFKLETFGKTTVVVGHSNTNPTFVNKIIGANTYEDIPDEEYRRVYKVVLTGTEHEVTIDHVE